MNHKDVLIQAAICAALLVPTACTKKSGDQSKGSSSEGSASTTDAGLNLQGGVSFIDSDKKLNADRVSAAGTGGRAAYNTLPAYNEGVITQMVQAHQSRAAGGQFKYVFIEPKYAQNKEMSNVLRLAIGKAWNHLSWLPEIDMPEDVSDGAGLVFALNVGKVWGRDGQQNWGYIANCTNKGIEVSPADKTGCNAFNANQPAPSTRWVFNAVNGNPYALIHDTPGDYTSFRSKFDLGPILHVSTHKEAIVCGPRITAYRSVNYRGTTLIYSFSSDEFNGRDNEDINYRQAPTLDNERGTGAFSSNPNGESLAIASEWWMTLPNGFLYWGIHGEGSQERGRAESPFAIDPANWNQGWELQTGRSCITCHVAGIQSAKTDRGTSRAEGWSTHDELSVFYTQVRERFQGAMKRLVAGLSDGDASFNERIIAGTIEPISKAIREVEGPYPGNQNCEFFCNGKYGRQRQNLCSTLPLK